MGKIVKTWTRHGGERERELPEATGKPKQWWVLRIQPNEFGTPDSCGSASLSNREVFSSSPQWCSYRLQPPLGWDFPLWVQWKNTAIWELLEGQFRRSTKGFRTRKRKRSEGNW